MNADTIVGYSYQADTYCPRCILKAISGVQNVGNCDTEKVLDIVAGVDSINRYDENSYDSGDFPKVIFAVYAYLDDVCALCGENLK